MPDPGLLDRLMQFVAAEFDVPVEQLRQRGRHNNWGRQAVIWLAHQAFKLSAEEVAELLGDLSGSAVRDSLRRTRVHFEQPAGATFCEALLTAEMKLLARPSSFFGGEGWRG